MVESGVGWLGIGEHGGQLVVQEEPEPAAE